MPCQHEQVLYAGPCSTRLATLGGFSKPSIPAINLEKGVRNHDLGARARCERMCIRRSESIYMPIPRLSWKILVLNKMTTETLKHLPQVALSQILYAIPETDGQCFRLFK